MPVGPQRSPYPKSAEEVRGSRWELAHRLYGAGELHPLFKGAPKTMTPWPSAGRQKNQPMYDPARVHAALRDPQAHLTEMDPRNLHATQPWVTAEGTRYYMGSQYRETGRTFADMQDPANRYPVIYTNQRGHNLALTGHHRATAALLHGEQFRAIHIEE